MDYTTHRKGKHLTIELEGEFSNADRDSFSKILHFFEDPKLKHITFDLKSLIFVDSSALGMFLIARQSAISNSDMFLDIVNVGGQPKRSFEIAKFDTIMNFS